MSSICVGNRLLGLRPNCEPYGPLKEKPKRRASFRIVAAVSMETPAKIRALMLARGITVGQAIDILADSVQLETEVSPAGVKPSAGP